MWEIVHAPASYAAWRKISREAAHRNAELRAHNAALEQISFAPEGHISIGVSGDLRAARQILKDLLKLRFVSVVTSAHVTST